MERDLWRIRKRQCADRNTPVAGPLMGPAFALGLETGKDVIEGNPAKLIYGFAKNNGKICRYMVYFRMNK
ncbi:MAG: hypothetical protein NC079_05815 [Clostridium sp.]|nr:hypothetical protein [Acetatifactor muris]MCM1526946.1 hypothetical protein [Bacteroides sp.]MCM1563109.1 hypothetical protein [Clostridium sp.]